jgi:hypothetical protein
MRLVRGTEREGSEEFTSAWSIKSDCASRLSSSGPCFLSMWSFNLVKSHEGSKDE